MADHTIARSPSAYHYPLLIKQLLATLQIRNADQEIVYGDRYRYSYREFARRVARLANALETLGVRKGDTVAVLDWDSHRYLECFFDSDDWCRTAHSQHPLVCRSGAVHNEPRR